MLAGGLCLGSGGMALAQSESTDSCLELFRLDESFNREISIASKSTEGVLDAPSSVTVFTAEEIHQMGIQNLEELLNFVPGFQATRDVAQGTANRVSARGRGS